MSKCCVYNLATAQIGIQLKSQVALTNDLERIAAWIEANGLRLNVETQLTQENCPLPLRGVDIEESTAIKYLGVTIDQDLKWKTHTNNIRNKTLAALATIRRSYKKASISLTHLSAPTWTTVQWSGTHATPPQARD